MSLQKLGANSFDGNPPARYDRSLRKESVLSGEHYYLSGGDGLWTFTINAAVSAVNGWVSADAGFFGMAHTLGRSAHIRDDGRVAILRRGECGRCWSVEDRDVGGGGLCPLGAEDGGA